MDLTQLTDHDLDERGILTHEPRWARQERKIAWQAFLESSEPNWKKLKLPKVDVKEAVQFSFPQEGVANLKVEKKPPKGCAGKITLKDGKVWRISLKPELAYQGVILSDLQTAILERADLVEQYLKENRLADADRLDFLNAALWENGVFLWVPEGVQVEEPFQIQVIQSDLQKSLLAKNLIVVEDGAKAILEELVEQDAPAEEGDQTVLNSQQSDFFIGEGAECSVTRLQNWAANIYDLCRQELNVKRDGKLTLLNTILGGQAGRTTVVGRAVNPQASIEHDGVLIADKNQHYKLVVKNDHQAQHTHGCMRYKGILSGKANSFLDGLIRVSPKASLSESRLEEHTLILSEKARCDALPALDIQTDDVQVSHSASVTKADPEKIFYLMSRGLSRDEAQQLIVQGFFEDLLGTIKRQEWYDFNKQLIEAKLSQTNLLEPSA